jgi:hypothetical protein
VSFYRFRTLAMRNLLAEYIMTLLSALPSTFSAVPYLPVLLAMAAQWLSSRLFASALGRSRRLPPLPPMLVHRPFSF